jgi:hypothetical protein
MQGDTLLSIPLHRMQTGGTYMKKNAQKKLTKKERDDWIKNMMKPNPPMSKWKRSKVPDYGVKTMKPKVGGLK